MKLENFDVLIIGAGIAGIGAAYHLQQRCPDKSYAIIEARQAIGGTWDLFRYPGIRSDSDMFTMGYSFKPWSGSKLMASGDAILEYIQETAAEFQITKKIRFNLQVLAAEWSSLESLWTLRLLNSTNGEQLSISCNFLHMCCGYYDYHQPYAPLRNIGLFGEGCRTALSKLGRRR
ncbi:MAG: NAD(P)/FAD-dependent oxidoreductase [Pseudomonadales bacterium]|nr:NAD(P)/FAD-dependent oxidoreductase [Pseudomonadales bacterium]